MNLRFKLSKKLTAVIQIVNPTTAIFSDECTPSHKETLRIITASDFETLKIECFALATQLASETRFQPIVAVVSGDTYKIFELDPVEKEEKSSDILMF